MAEHYGVRGTAFLLGIVALATVGGCSSTDRLSNAWSEKEGQTAEGNQFIRIHYRLQEDGDVTTWGLHFWNAGADAPNWGTPQLFDQRDEFGGFTDVPVTVVDDVPDDPAQGESPWLGILPVHCTGSAPNFDCRKDIEQNARFFDLSKNEDNPNIAEGWLTQGQAIVREKPTPNETIPFTIERPNDFIDPGQGEIRMMFRVPHESIGQVSFNDSGPTSTWTKWNNVNRDGLIVGGLKTDIPQVYTITSLRKFNGAPLVDKLDNLQLTPDAFTTITDAKDWADWGRSKVMYEIIVRTFADGGTPRQVGDPTTMSGIDTSKKDGIGDLVGLKASLEYLNKDLGVDTILITPFFKSRSYHGYDIEDFETINPDFGTIADFRALTKEAHKLGMQIILEVVQSYVADTNPWFVKASDPNDAEHEKYRDYFVWADGYSHMTADAHPWDESNFVWTCKKYQCYHQVSGISLPQLNFHNPDVRVEMKNVAQHWISHGADGFKVTASALIDVFDDINEIALSHHGTHAWWKDFNAYIKSLTTTSGNRALLIGDNRWDDPANAAKMVPFGGDMDAQMDFPFRTIVGNFINGAAHSATQPHDFVGYVNDLRQKFEDTTKGGNPNHYLLRFLSTHDFERPATQFPFIGDVQTNKLKQAATIVFTLPGTPMIYYGEEFGKRGAAAEFEGSYRDEFKREPMSWFQNLVFDGDNIDYAKTNAINANQGQAWGMTLPQNPNFPHIKFMSSPDHASLGAQKNVAGSLFAHYHKLITIRRDRQIFGDIQTNISVLRDDPAMYVYTLENPQEKKITVALNRTSIPQSYDCTVTELLSDTSCNNTSVSVPPFGAAILE